MFEVGQKVIKKIQGDKSGNHLENFIQPNYIVVGIDNNIVTVKNEFTNELYEYDTDGFKLNPKFWDHEVKQHNGSLLIKTYIISRIFPVENK